MLDKKGNVIENVGRLGAFDNENGTNFVRVAKEQALAHSHKKNCSRVRTSTIIQQLRLCLGGDLLVDASETQPMLD